MALRNVARGTKRRGIWSRPRASRCTVFAAIYTLTCTVASADSVAIAPDPPARKRTPPRVGAGALRPTWDLDGLYLWLGPTGGAGWIDADWDSTFGVDLAIVRVRERSLVSAIGIDAGASLWSARDGGRIWLDGVLGTRIGGRIYGVTAGPLVELAETQHPRYGGSVGAWAFFGITPFVRLGTVQELGTFVDVGVHIALPVFRR